jgi:putative transposase
VSAKTSLCANHRFGSHIRQIPEPHQRCRDRGARSSLDLTDITYIRLPTTFCYLAAILDAYSRKCVGWHLSRWIDTRLTLLALEMALAARQPETGLIHHSDQGVQYASSEYILRLEEAGAQISMAAVSNPYQNAKAESFFRTLKMEEVYLKDYCDFEEAEENIGHFIEEVYNKKRLHSSLGYLPPVDFEALHALRDGS